MGGVVQGLGYALMEDIPVDPESGAPLTLNLDSFKIPNLVDVPPIEPVLIEHPDPVGPYGAKSSQANRRSYPWPRPSPTPFTTQPVCASAISQLQRKRFSAFFSNRRVKCESEN